MNLLKTVAARGLVNGRGPNRRFGRDSVFNRFISSCFISLYLYIFISISLYELLYHFKDSLVTLACKVFKIVGRGVVVFVEFPF